MKNKKNNKFWLRDQIGQTSRLLLVLAAIILVAVIIVFLVMRMATPAPKPPTPGPEEVQLPVYEKQLGNIRFVFLSGLNKGGVLKSSEIKNSQYNSSYQKDLAATPGGDFIQITIGAQNKGNENTEQNAWDIENIVDSKGRNFVPIETYTVAPWIDAQNQCGALLKPEFDPLPCTKIYEVSKQSTGLKIRIETGLDNDPGNLSSGKIEEFLLDLIVK